MTKIIASVKACRYSKHYMTFLYVREVEPGVFEPWAHSSEDGRTVAVFYCGERK